jgi:signal transduction histidine kinase
MPATEPANDAATRVEEYTTESNFGWVVAALVAHRDEILARWLDATAAQPFHHSRRERAVADHIPALFDALMALLERSAPVSIDPSTPLDDPAILVAARGHALMRVDQGLRPVDVLTEFRLLRQELWHALRQTVPDSAPTSDIVGAELLLNDALDGAGSLALAALTERLDQVREELLAMIVHDVRQPLTQISGYAQLAERQLRRPTPDPDRIAEALQRIRTNSAAMGALLNTLVDSSRTALGGLTLQCGPADLAQLLRDTIGRLTPDLAERIRLHIQDGADTTGHWDKARLRQVFENILANAGKYSPPDTLITVAVQAEPASVVVQVADQGIGIPPEELPRLFKRYARAENALAEGIDGLGLGLYLCRGIVEAHGGRIWATSPGRDQGTTIHVELPRQVTARPASE